MAAGTELAAAYVSLTISANQIAPQVNKQFGAVEKQADKSGKSAGKRLSAGIAGAFAGVLAGIGVKDFLGDALAEARESQKVGALTSSIIKSTGGAAKVTEKQIGDLASALSRKTGIDDEAIQTGSNLLLTFKNVRNEAGAGNDMFNKATAAALDLSKAGFGSVDGAAKMLGKALNDPVKGISALGRAGVTFTEQQKKQIKTMTESGDVLGAQKIIMSEVESQVGGAAAATATAGDKARVTFDNLKESAGTYLLPVVDKLSTKFVTLVEEFQSGVGAGGRFKEIIVQVRDGVMSAVDWFRRYQDILIPLGGAVLAIVAAMKVWSAITKAYVAIQTALNVVMSANPIGLVVLAIVGLVAALVLAYKKSETFRAIVDAAWKGVKAAISGVVDWFRNTAWPWMRDAFTWIGDKAKALWGQVKIAWDGIKGGVSAVVSWFRDVAWPVLRNAFQWIADKAGWLWNNIIKPYFNAMSTLWKTVFGFLRDTVWPIARDAFANIAAKGKWMWESVLKPAFDAIKTGVGRVKDAFETAKNGIGAAWGKLEGLAKKPVKFIIQTVLNDGLIAGFNWLSGKIGGPHVDPIRLPKGFATGGVLPGYTPGRDVHRFYSPTGGRLDLSGGEAIMRPEFTRLVGGESGVARLNAMARAGRVPMQAFAGGGVFGSVKDALAGGASWLWDKASAAFKALSNPLGYLKGKLPSIPGAGVISDYTTGVKDKLLGLAVDKIKGLFKTFQGAAAQEGGQTGAAVTGPGGAMRWQAIWNLIRSVAPESRMTSNYRPGAITASGFPSKHGMGRAVDLVSSNMMATFNKLRPLRPWTELYYSPAGNRQLLNGRPHYPTGITRQMHFSHIHAAMARGGVIPKPLLFDRGGVLPQGTSMVHNATGAPEPLARVDQMGGDIIVNLDVNDLRALRTVEDFVSMVGVRSRMTAGVR